MLHTPNNGKEQNHELACVCATCTAMASNTLEPHPTRVRKRARQRSPRHEGVFSNDRDILPSPPGLRLSSTSNVFHIEKNIAARVFWHLLDGTGISTHCEADITIVSDFMSRTALQALVQDTYNE